MEATTTPGIRDTSRTSVGDRAESCGELLALGSPNDT
jgi:hypothetical protein